MAYENRPVQSSTANTLPTGTDPLVDNTALGDVQAVKLIDATAGSTTPLAGQKARAASLSTTLSTEDIAALTPPAAISGFSTEITLASILTKLSADPASQTTLAAILAKIITAPATEAKQDTGNTSVASIDTKTPALGQALAAASTPVVLTAAQVTTLTPPAAITGFLTESDFDTKAGALTETAPATDTASSGLNGRLQRIAQRITSLITALGSPFQAGGSIGNTAFGATQSGTWTVQPGNTANTTAWKVDGSAVTQPVSSALGATAAKQPALGTAGSASADVITVQGIASGTPQPVQAATGTLTARNSTITAGGTAQTLAASNSSRKYLLIQNQSVESLYVSFTGTAVADKTSMKLSPGDSYESPAGYVSTQAVSIIGATTGSAFYAVEG